MLPVIAIHLFALVVLASAERVEAGRSRL